MSRVTCLKRNKWHSFCDMLINLEIVYERFAGVVHVEDTSSATLKASIDTLFAQHKLSLKQALQIKDQNILEADSVINGTKESLMTLRANGFDGILKKVNIFCAKYDIEVLKMA
ncbi:hypothetical protein Tco_0966661 [Tanacetum coccineum]